VNGSSQPSNDKRTVRTGAYAAGEVKAHGGGFARRDVFGVGALLRFLVGGVPKITIEQALRNRQAMIRKVRYSWIDGVLHKSLYRVACLELKMQEQPQAAAHPWETIVQEQGREPRVMGPTESMVTVFDDLGRSLLILGKPGTGKTTMLLELAEKLLERAERDIGHPIPVVFNLSTWAVERRALADWLVDELNQRYRVPLKQAEMWVGGGQVLPLLDGLDEVVSVEERRTVPIEILAVKPH